VSRTGISKSSTRTLGPPRPRSSPWRRPWARPDARRPHPTTRAGSASYLRIWVRHHSGQRPSRPTRPEHAALGPLRGGDVLDEEGLAGSRVLPLASRAPRDAACRARRCAEVGSEAGIPHVSSESWPPLAPTPVKLGTTRPGGDLASSTVGGRAGSTGYVRISVRAAVPGTDRPPRTSPAQTGGGQARPPSGRDHSPQASGHSATRRPGRRPLPDGQKNLIRFGAYAG
jgi:hypothetical protein